MTRNILFILCLSGLLTNFTSCNKFTDINTNPDATSNVNASMLATSIILKNFKFNGRDAMAYISDNGLAKYLAYANQSMMSTQYGLVGAADFSNMTILPNLENMEKYALGSTMENSYKALAKFHRAFMFYHITMKVGDIPYSETGMGAEGKITPKYDAQQEVFKGILKDLEDANLLFASAINFNGDPTPYAGNVEKWRRATNAFRLKVLLSLSKRAGNSDINIANEFAKIVQENFLLTESTGFLGLNYNAVNMHPVSGTNDIFTSRTIVSSTIIDHLKSLNDRRMYYYADPSKAQINGGKAKEDPDAYVGALVSDRYEDITSAHLNNTYSLINSRYLKNVTSEPRMILTYAEQQLILAEARILGWINTGNAQDYYESGVKAALKHLMDTDPQYANGMAITTNYIDNYFTGEAAFKANAEDQLKQIWLQKYLMNFMQDPINSFYEYRRTGYPEFPIDISTSLNENKKDAIPVRWTYPSSENNYNRENLIEALNRQFGGVDDPNQLMWLLK